ncbi:MAG: membrane anchor subunit [Candidatus Tokpelaia sp. JSC189]|nr:MAG: membrane anchor subunit [Candidatus Tokpelaia sp. JSC189]
MAKDFRTPLGKVGGLGSTKNGTRNFCIQRFTAMANVPLFIFFIVLVVTLVGQDYDHVYNMLANPIIALVMGLMILSAVYHMKLGMQVIIEDYVHNERWRIFILALNIFFCFSMGAACILALLKITLRG